MEGTSRLGRELARIRTEVAVPFEPESLRYRGASRERCFELFSALGFRSLVTEFAPAAQPVARDYQVVELTAVSAEPELPAALLVAFGLRQQVARLIGPLKLERIIGALRLAGIGFILYAVVEGVLVPAAPFFPASVLNETTLYRACGIPIGVWRALAGAVIVWCFSRALDVFRFEAAASV